MPKLAKSSTAKVSQICQEYPCEFSANPADGLRCNLYDVLVKLTNQQKILSDIKLTRISLLHNGKLWTTKSDTVLPTALHEKYVNGVKFKDRQRLF